MQIRKLKVATLQLIEPDGTELDENQIDTYEDDDNYSPYLRAFMDSLNGCLSRITSEKKTPLKILEVKLTKGKSIYDLSEIADDIYSIEHVSFCDNQGNSQSIQFNLISNSHLEAFNFDGKVHIYYHRLIPLLENDNNFDLKTVGITDNLASIIKYYIKADVYESEEPSRAVMSRNIFETYLSNIKSTNYVVFQDKIESGFF